MSVPEVSGPPSRADTARFSYKAFISYSHAADGHLAASLQAALQGFAKAWYRRRSIRVFRDTTGLEVTPDLWASIRKALEASEYFILLASERAAQSRWIELELDTWLRADAADRVLIVWTDGDLAWDPAAGDFDWQRSTCLPPRLRGVFRAEPLHLDLRWARKSEDLSLRRPELVDAIARISATLRQLPLDDLVGEDVRQHRRTRRLAGTAVATLSVLLVSAVAAAWFAVQQRNAARRSLVDLIVSNGVKELDEGDLSAAALWFAEAVRLGDGRAREQSLQRIRLHAAVRAHPALRQVWFTDRDVAYRSARFGRDGPYVISRAMRGEIASADGQVKVKPLARSEPRVWDARSGDSVSLTIPSAPAERTLAVDAWAGGMRIVTAGPGSTARVLDARSGAEIVRLDHPGEVAAADFGQDGRVILTESNDNAVRIWDAADGRLLEAIPHESTLISAGVAADGRTVVSTTADGAAHVWHLGADSEKSRHARLDHDDAVELIEVSKDGRHAITVASRTARLWSLSSEGSPSVLRSWIGVNHAEFSPNGAALLIADDFGEASVFGLDPLEPAVVVRHSGLVLHATFSPDGDQFATAGTDRVARIWDASSGTPLSARLHHEQTVTHVAFDAGQARLATATAEGLIRVWDLGGKPAALPHESIRLAEFHPDGRGLLTASFGEIKRWDLDGGPPLTLSAGSQIYDAALSPDGRRIASASEDGLARIWDAATGAELHALRHEARVHHASFRPDGTWLATASGAGANAAVSLWDVATGKKIFSLPHHSERPDNAEFSPDGSKLLTSGAGVASIWDLMSRQRHDAFHDDDDLTSPAFSPDGRLVVVVSGRTSAKVYDVARASPVGQAIQHENYRIDHVEFGADSTTLLIASAGYARVWDVRSGVPLTPPLTHGPGTSVNHVVASRDGQFLATAAASHGTARAWHAQTGQALTPPLVHGSGLREVLFSPDGSQIITFGGNAARVWPLSSGASMNDQQLARYARVLAARQLDGTGGIVPLDVTQFRDAWEAQRATSGSP